MERVRDLSWGSPFASIAVKARTGFEPVFSEEGHEGSLGNETGAAQEPDSRLSFSASFSVVQRLTNASRKGARES